MFKQLANGVIAANRMKAAQAKAANQMIPLDDDETLPTEERARRMRAGLSEAKQGEYQEYITRLDEQAKEAKTAKKPRKPRRTVMEMLGGLVGAKPTTRPQINPDQLSAAKVAAREAGQKMAVESAKQTGDGSDYKYEDDESSDEESGFSMDSDAEPAPVGRARFVTAKWSTPGVFRRSAPSDDSSA